MKSSGNAIQDLFMFLDHKKGCLLSLRPSDDSQAVCTCGLETARNHFLSLMAANLEVRKTMALESIAESLSKIQKDGITSWKGEV